jgi:hypothetical protein
MTPRMARLGRLGLLVLAITLATTVLGWLGPMFVGLVFVALDGRESVPGESAVGAAVAWTLILLVTALSAGARPVGVIGAALGVPVVVLSIASILFAAGLAWSSATLALFVRRALVGSRRPGPLAEPAHR